ncbi:Alpha/beta hydrolase family protein [Posidoniimonas polymericola]|uniref:Alpha/beta hydrolase family protein n=1 Tax=Posidoniimonas polymericola TaxID=2528002 RepID=A0A5C5YR80_9BACT|nr:Alpha/beta hydrolase family protein [Posidoniimonas polymericola]
MRRVLLVAGLLAALSPAASADLPQQPGWRGWLRQCATCDADHQRYCMKLDDAWAEAPTEVPVVVQVHGFNSNPAHTRALVKLVRGQGLPCGEFAYPNDQPLRASAELLSAQLRLFAEQHPERRVALVTHSMGGLVARECLEDDGLWPGNVDRLIMVAPPTHGSTLARYAVGLDLWEHWIVRNDGADPWRRVRESIADGLSEAPADLRPGSKFLRRLNARDRREEVRYTVLLGSAAQVSEEHRYLVRQTLLKTAELTPGWETDAAAVDRALACMDEVTDGKGDGAVAISRGRLPGVADTVVLPFSHLGVVHGDQEPGGLEARQVILDRLLQAAPR